MHEVLKKTHKDFAIVLGNLKLQDSLVLDFTNSLEKILENLNNKHEWGQVKVRHVTAVNMDKKVLKVGTSVFVFIQELADSIQEVMPMHGISVLPWSVYSI